jgi:hypothetical protein
MYLICGFIFALSFVCEFLSLFIDGVRGAKANNRKGGARRGSRRVVARPAQEQSSAKVFFFGARMCDESGLALVYRLRAGERLVRYAMRCVS